MKKTTEKKNHGNAIIMHLKRHHRKYLFGAFGGFAIVKAILLFFGLGPVLNIGNIFAGSEDPIILNASNFNDYCSTGYAYESSVDITCTGGIEKVESGAFSEYSNIRWLYLSGNNISEIEAGAFSGLTIETLDLSYNKLSNIDFEVFSGSTITTLDISHNQIYEVSNPETINNTTVDISYNCLPNSMIDEIENKTGEDYQYVCLYVEYSPNYWTNSGVQATLSVTGNDDIVSEISSLTTLITFDDNGTGVINFDDAFLSYSGDILNYPEDSQIFPAYVNWIDKTEPTCGERDYTPSIEERSTGITATLYGSYDNDTGAGIDISGGICLLTENETPCEVEISDLAGNTKKCYTSIPNKIDNTKPTCERSGLSTDSLEMGQTGNITLRCTDNLAGIQTMNITSGDISFSSGGVLQINNISTGSITGGVKYDIEFQAIGSGTTTLTLNANSVLDNANNGNQEGMPSAEISVHDEQQEPTGPLVYFEKQPSGNWSQSEEIIIHLQDGVTGCYRYQVNTGGSRQFGNCQYITGSVTLNITNENRHSGYICVLWQSGSYTGFVCSDDPVLVDRSNPNIELLGPVNGTSVYLGDTITLSWSGSDNESGLSGYKLTIQEPNNNTGYSYYNSGETSTGVSVDQTGTRFWSVTAYDNVENQESSNGWFFGVLSGDDSPEILGDLVSFEKQPHGNWSRSEEIIIHWQDGATGGYLIKNDNNTGILWNEDSYTGSNGDDITLTFTDENNNGEYVCAFGQTGEHITTICTNHPIRVDITPPTCGNWTYVPNSGNTNGWSNTEITATLSDSTDEGGSEILTGGGSCTIESGENSTCTVTISDNAGNTTGCMSSGFNIDTQAPTISFNKTGGSPATGHKVIVTATDDGSKLAANQKIQYKRSTGNDCGTQGFTEVGLTPIDAGITSATVTITTNDLSDGNYYLCILSGTVEDQVGNKNEAERTLGVFIVDNTKPICERSGLSTNSLEMGQTGTITLTCTDNLAGIQTMNITSSDISFSSEGVLQINNISTGSITSGIMYNIKFEAIGSGTTTLTLRTNRVKDNANNGNPAGITSDGISVNDNNGNNHNSPENPIEISGLVTIDGPSGNWVDEEKVEIHWNSGATGGYLIKNNKISDIQWNKMLYTGSNGDSITLTFTGESTGNRFICAFGQTGGYITSICSEYPVKIDRSNPNLQLLSPANGTSVNLGDSITLSRSGSDGKSGISGYVLKITTPSGTDSFPGGRNFTGRTISLNKTGNRSRSVTAYDNTAHYITRVGTFVVQQNGGGGDTPVPGALVSFGRQPSGNWTDGETIIINWHNGATGGYRYQTSTGSRQAGSYTQVSSGSATLNIRDENHNKYICAYGQTGGYTGFICSTHPVKVDITNPSLSLVYPDPSVSYDFKKGTNIRFVWSGNDDRSGISGYVFDVVSPSGLHDPHNFGSNTTAYTKTLNETGRRYWYVTGYDNTNHRIYKSGSFYVSEDGGIPENGFYLISPALGAQINLGNNVVLSWNPGTVNSGYIWTVKKISGTTIATGTTTGLTATVNSGKFSTGAYSRSVKDIATDTTKSISLFYIVDSSDVPDLEVNPFEFNEVENADLDEYYSSNRITIRGLSGDWYTLAYLGSGIGALYINGKFVGTSGYVQNGDKVYIEMKASDEYNKTVKTTLFVGVGSNTVSGDFKITTKNGIHDWDDSSLTPMQKLWGVIYVDSLVEMYQYDEKKLATFLSTFMQLLQDKSDYYASKIQEAEEDGDEELAKEYKLYKEAIDFLYITVKYRYDNIDTEDRTVYIAPNGKQYLVEYDEDRRAYTSPDFTHLKYFPSWELFTHHIDMNNPAVGKWGIVGNVITTHNGKVYTIYETNGKWTSSNFKTAKYFDTKEDIINHILANNPASDWDHKIDTDFDEVKHTAPNGKVYKILKTSSKGNNPNMYTSYNFVNAKYFTSLEAAKKFINQNNPK